MFLYSTGSALNRVQVVLSGFSVHAKNLCKYDCMYFLAALMLVCRCDVMVIVFNIQFFLTPQNI